MDYREVRVQQELRRANAELRGIHEELWLANQTPDVRAAVQRQRAETERGRRVIAIGVVGLVGVWWVLKAVFGARVGDGFASGALWLLYYGMEWALVLGVVLWLWSALAKGARWLAGTRASAARPDEQSGR